MFNREAVGVGQGCRANPKLWTYDADEPPPECPIRLGLKFELAGLYDPNGS
jgi:hypothetical protein